MLTQYQQPGCGGQVTGFAAYAFNTACGLWGPPTDVHYLSCNATSYTVNMYASDNGTCIGTPTQQTYPLGYWNGTGGGGPGPFDMDVLYAGGSICVSCYAPPASPPAQPAPLKVQQYYLQWTGASYATGIAQQTCAPRGNGLYLFFAPIPNGSPSITNGTMSFSFQPAVLVLTFSDAACTLLNDSAVISFSDPYVQSKAGSPATLSYAPSIPAAFPAASVVLTQYAQPGCAGQVLAYASYSLNTACGLWGPPTDVHYLSCNASGYTVNVYPSDNGTCTGAPMKVTYPLNFWSGSGGGGSGPFDLGIYGAFLCASCNVPPASSSPPPVARPPPSSSPPMPVARSPPPSSPPQSPAARPPPPPSPAYLLWSGPNAVSGYALGNSVANACTPNYEDVLGVSSLLAYVFC